MKPPRDLSGPVTFSHLFNMRSMVRSTWVLTGKHGTLQEGGGGNSCLRNAETLGGSQDHVLRLRRSLEVGVPERSD